MRNVYAEVGASLQQVGGDIPDGWIVMQGERPTPEHVAQEDGTWSLPQPTYEEKLAALSADYQKDVDAFNRAWATALLADGTNEAAKLAAIRSQYMARKDQYSTDYAALRNEYQK